MDSRSGDVRHTLKGHTGPVRGIALSADDRIIVSGSDDKTVRIWNAATGVQCGAVCLPRGMPLGSGGRAVCKDSDPPPPPRQGHDGRHLVRALTDDGWGVTDDGWGVTDGG